MKYCKKCVQPDTRPGIVFKDGVCAACKYTEGISKIDWNKRQRELESIVNWAKVTAGVKKSNYDCVIGVSGGKDSTFQSLYARDKLNLRPLLVNSEPEGITDIGKKNIENLKRLGFDVIALRPNPKVMKQLVKRDFYKFLNPVKITEYSLWCSAYIIADKFDIPLIIEGENPAQLLGVIDCLPADSDALNADKQNTLADGWEQYIEGEITEKDLFMFHYDRGALRARGIRGVWLSYYDRDWSPRRNADFAVKHGLTLRTDFQPEDIGTYVPFAQLDSDLVQVNQMLKYYKFGFGQCTDYACYDIRDGLITREEGFGLVEKYDGKCHPRYIEKFCDYIDITVEEFWTVVDKFVNRDLFEKVNGKWERKFTLK
jgi:N-acetyl sugar amidotransferase